jgi:ammonium transporter, Amt family
VLLTYKGYGFNPGSALLLGVDGAGAIAARAAATTSISGASGALSAMFINLYAEYEINGESYFSLTMAMNGVLSGLVAITAGCGTVELWASFLIGTVAGALYVGGHYLLLYFAVDDVVDGIPVHLVNGVWGMLATGLFSSPSATLAAYGSDDHVGWFYSIGSGSSDATLLGNQVLAVLFLIGWASCTMTPFFLMLQYFGWLRLESLDELVGLDQSYHGAALMEAQEEVLADVKEFDRVARKLNGNMSNSRSGSNSKTSQERSIRVGSVVEVGKINENDAFAI